MTKVIAQYDEVVILEDSIGKFLFSRNDEIVELSEPSKLPIINVHANIPNRMSCNLYREAVAMLS
jgi:hypothetical protein